MTGQTIAVRGNCPMGCGPTLSLDPSGHITCSRPDCPRPDAVSTVLEDREAEHILDFGTRGFTVRHPLRERLDDALMRCELHRYCTALGRPPDPAGRYRAIGAGGGWTFEPVAVWDAPAAALTGASDGPADPAWHPSPNSPPQPRSGPHAAPKETPDMTTVHACPPLESGLTPCCGRSPFELPRTERMAIDRTLVTCHGRTALTVGRAMREQAAVERDRAESTARRLLDQRHALERRAETAEAALARVRGLHRPVDSGPDHDGACPECCQDYPCATLRALTHTEPAGETPSP